MLLDRSVTERHLRALQAIAEQESGHFCLVNVLDAEECCDRGWAKSAIHRGGYVLTAEGRLLLKDSG